MKKLLILFIFSFLIIGIGYEHNNVVHAEPIIFEVGDFIDDDINKVVISVDTSFFVLYDFENDVNTAILGPFVFTSVIGSPVVNVEYSQWNQRVSKSLRPYDYKMLYVDVVKNDTCTLVFDCDTYASLDYPTNLKLEYISLECIDKTRVITFYYNTGYSWYITIFGHDGYDFYDFSYENFNITFNYYAHTQFSANIVQEMLHTEFLKYMDEMYTDSYDFVYREFYNERYNGLVSTVENATFGKLFRSLYSVPIKAIDSIFNINIFGYDLRYLPRTLFTICLFTFFVRKLF